MPFQDDDTILAPHKLWRRVPDSHWVYDEGLQRARPSSDAFRDDPDGDPMSVYWEAHNQPPTAAAVLAGHDNYKIAAVTAQDVRNHALGVFQAPVDGFPSHCKVFGEKTKRNVDRKLAKASSWVVGPTDEEVQQKRQT